MKKLIFVLAALFCVILTAIADDAADYTLQIFGNANMDEIIDEADITYIEGIISGSNEETELSDANCDDLIDENDISHIEKMIDGSEVQITFLDSDGKKVTVTKPIDRILSLGTTHLEVLRSLGAEDKIIGISTYITDKPDFFPKYADTPTVGSGYTPDYEAIISMNPDLVLQFSGWTLEMEEKLATTDIAVARLGLKLQNYISEVALLGYLLGVNDRAGEVIDFHQKYMKTISDGIDGLSEEEMPRVYLEWDPEYQTDNSGSLDQLCNMAGGVNIAKDLPGKNPIIEAEWLMTENPTIIVKFPFRKNADHGYLVDDISGLSALRDAVMSRAGLSEITAVKEERVYIVGQEIVSGPRSLVAIAYMAKWFHPDLFEDLDPQAIHQEYLTNFQGLEYNLSEHGVFVYPI